MTVLPPNAQLPHTGAPAPEDRRHWLEEPAEETAKAEAPEYTIPPFTGDRFAFVPPLARGRIPVTSAVRETAENVGAEAPLP